MQKIAWLARRNLNIFIKSPKLDVLCLIFFQDVRILNMETLLRKKLDQRRFTLGFLMKM